MARKHTDRELDTRDARVINRLAEALIVLEEDRMAAVERANECAVRSRGLRKAIAEERWGELRGILTDAEIESLSDISPSIWEDVEDEVEAALRGN